MRHPLTAVIAVPVVVVAGMLAIPILSIAHPPDPPTVLSEQVPVRVLAAYRKGASHCEGLRWELLAGIGWVESRHGTTAGATTDPDTGAVSPPILGAPLDGRDGREFHLVGEWRGRWGLPGPYEQALGPMQFRPPTFADWGIDVDENGTADPHDIDDAAATAAAYLCGTNPTMDDERAALFRYNHDAAYVDAVLTYADTLNQAVIVGAGGWLCPVAGKVSFTDTWGAPRSGGRRHQGVDIFAANGTPVIAPVPGHVTHGSGGLGGLSFRLHGDDGHYYYGAHLSQTAPVSGRVEAGTILGYVGTTGNALGTPPHLHFEIHPNRKPGQPPKAINPTPTVAAACQSARLGLQPLDLTGE